MTTPTKPRTDAAQKVYEAAHEAWITKDDPEHIAAAALRAAAAQIAAEEVPPHVTGDVYWPWRNGRATAEEHLLAIATELEGANG
jgi:propanediol dehydratase small subunit